jgi:hypothetical protein
LADWFEANLTFRGTMAGRLGTASLTYLGQTQAGGTVDGLMVIAGGTGELANVGGVLSVEATAGAGGRYRGSLEELR